MNKQQKRIQQAHQHLNEFFRHLSSYTKAFGKNFETSLIWGRRQLKDSGGFVKGFLEILRHAEGNTSPTSDGLDVLRRALSREVNRVRYDDASGRFEPAAGDPFRMAAEHLVRYLELITPKRGFDPIVRILGMREAREECPHGVCEGIGCKNLFLRKGGRKTCSAKCSRSRKDVKARRNERMKAYLALKRECERWGHVWPGKQQYNARPKAQWERAKHKHTVLAQEACRYCSVRLKSL